MRIGTKILCGFGAVTALTLGLGWYSLAKQAEVRASTGEMVDRDFQTLHSVAQITEQEQRLLILRLTGLAQAALRKAGVRLEATSDAKEEYRRVASLIAKLLEGVQANSADYERTAVMPERAAQWGRVRTTAAETEQAASQLQAAAEVLLPLLERGEVAQAVAHTPRIDRLRADFEARVQTLQELIDRQIDTGQRQTAVIYDQARVSTLAALAAALVLGVLCGVVIHRSIVRPLGSFVEVVEKVGQGDLTRQAPAVSRDELGDMARSLNQMVSGLRELASQTRGATENLSAATAEIVASTQQQAAGATEQAVAVQQTNATLAEISQSGSQITERARQVAAAAEATSQATGSGLQAVEGTTRTMEAIREQAEAVAGNIIALSDKTQAVGEIIASVNDIAEQSHLLALNAAIEAAAAGEHGRSFSVVAAEIKNLADQSKQATVQVRSILGEIQKGINSSVLLTEEAVKRVEAGKQQAEIATGAIRQLIDSVQQSIQAFQQIAAGANQQQIGVDQVVQAVRSISVASEQNAASTRQMEKAASSLNAMAQQLRSMVERYRL
jgi:methyl-accepting chemotaxis protein